MAEIVDLTQERVLRQGSPQLLLELALYEGADGSLAWASEVRVWVREGETPRQRSARLDGRLADELRRLADEWDPRPPPRPRCRAARARVRRRRGA